MVTDSVSPHARVVLIQSLRQNCAVRCMVAMDGAALLTKSRCFVFSAGGAIMDAFLLVRGQLINVPFLLLIAPCRAECRILCWWEGRQEATQRTLRWRCKCKAISLSIFTQRKLWRNNQTTPKSDNGGGECVEAI